MSDLNDVRETYGDAKLLSLVRDLRAHQIELELQNQELITTQLELSQSLERFSNLYNFAPVGYATLCDRGMILRANKTATDLLGADSLLGRPLTDFLANSSQDLFYLARKRSGGSGAKQACELLLAPPAQAHSWIHLEITPAGPGDAPSACHWVTLHDISDRKRAEMSANESTRKLRAVQVRLAESQAKERAQLACALHEQIGAGLTGLGLNLSRLRLNLSCLDDKACHSSISLLESCQNMVKDITSSVRLVHAGLRPPLLDDLGLAAALRSEQRALFKTTNITGELKGEISSKLPEAAEVALLFIAREAMLNAKCHSKCQRVRLLLQEDQSGVRLRIEDDGIGIGASQEGTSGWGLLSMGERAKSIGAELSVESSSTGGTVVTVTVKMP